MDIREYIDKRVKSTISFLTPQLKTWAQKHLVTPRIIKLHTDIESSEEKEFWLVTDHIGIEDSSSRVVYDEEANMFGLAMRINNGSDWRNWMMGCYGEFNEAIESM